MWSRSVLIEALPFYAQIIGLVLATNSGNLVDLARNWYFVRKSQESIKFLLDGCRVREHFRVLASLVSIAPGKYLFSFGTQKSSPVAAIILLTAGN